jgi:ketosteroid isomerase-like protein
MGSKLDAKAKRVLQAGNLTLLITEWSLSRIEPDGKLINLTGRGIIVLRRQLDDSWLMVIENPWEQNNQNAYRIILDNMPTTVDYLYDFN